MLAVGATNNMAPPTIKDFSARGPAPEPYPPERIKPDVVSLRTRRNCVTPVMDMT